MIELTVKAFDLADIYQTPVIVLSDMLLSENHRSLPEKFIKDLMASYKIKRGKVVSSLNLKSQNSNPELKTQSFLRYKLTGDGISERLIPGTKGFYYQVNSYEHLEDGHTTEEAIPRLRQVDKRARKTNTYLENDFVLPNVYGDLEGAETVFVGWGSIKGAVFEAQKLLNNQGKKTAFIHFTHIYPLDENKVRAMFKPEKKYVLIENNSTGQFGKLLRQECGIEIENKLLKYDGRPIWPEEIVNKLT
jgi:2-oxoglutarate ferredoxin oxidoreductase subunit alpha